MNIDFFTSNKLLLNLLKRICYGFQTRVWLSSLTAVWFNNCFRSFSTLARITAGKRQNITTKHEKINQISAHELSQGHGRSPLTPPLFRWWRRKLRWRRWGTFVAPLSPTGRLLPPGGRGSSRQLWEPREQRQPRRRRAVQAGLARLLGLPPLARSKQQTPELSGKGRVNQYSNPKRFQGARQAGNKALCRFRITPRVPCRHVIHVESQRWNRRKTKPGARRRFRLCVCDDACGCFRYIVARVKIPANLHNHCNYYIKRSTGNISPCSYTATYQRH